MSLEYFLVVLGILKKKKKKKLMKTYLNVHGRHEDPRQHSVTRYHHYYKGAVHIVKGLGILLQLAKDDYQEVVGVAENEDQERQETVSWKNSAAQWVNLECVQES